MRTMRKRCLLSALALTGALLGGCDETTALEGAAEQPAVSCELPGLGCECQTDATPTPCSPPGGATENDEGQWVCHEGYRHCRGGRWSACEDVQSFVIGGESTQAALVDPVAAHPRCSDCDPLCFFVVDTFDPSGVLDASFATDIEYAPEGGVRVSEMGPGAPPTPTLADFPPGSLFTSIAVGDTQQVAYTSLHRPNMVDVYFLVDMSATAGLALQELYDGFDAGTLLGAGVPCASGMPDQVGGGVVGGIVCMVNSAAFGSGYLRDIPFAPYGGIGPAAQTQTAFSQGQSIDTDATLTHASFAGFGGPQDGGDAPASQIPALHAVATGVGMDAGLARMSVPDGPACPGSDFGYPCFRDAADPIVVMLTDNPGHNASPPAGHDYDSALLTMTLGSGTPTAVPPTNDDSVSAYRLTDDATPILSTFTGDSTALTAQIPAGAVGCGADPAASDAVFTFGVDAGGSPTVPISFSSEGSDYLTALSIHDGPPQPMVQLPTLDDTNEHVGSSSSLGSVHDALYAVDGDTTLASGPGDMVNDYQGSAMGGSCSPNSRAPDSAFSFHVNGAGGPIDLDVSVDMGNQNTSLVIYAAGNEPTRWPLQTGAQAVSGNSSTLVGEHILPSGPGNRYITVSGNTSDVDIAADYPSADAGGGVCFPEDAAKDVAFRINVPSDTRLRFDTEGSSFDTVLSLHDAPPQTVAGNDIVYEAADTHSNTNTDVPSAFDAGIINGLRQTWKGDTTGMGASVATDGGCSLDGSCSDALYRITVTERTTVRMEVSGTGFEPGLTVTRAPPTGVPGGYPAIATGNEHTCAVSGGVVYCWGDDSEGQIGNGGGTGSQFATAQQVNVPGVVTQVAAGSTHGCAVNASGDVYCWGAGGDGRLGDGTGNDSDAPVKVIDIGPGELHGTAVQVAGGSSHSCALLSTGAVVCWGKNDTGQLGEGAGISASDSPVSVTTAERFEQIASNDDQVCGVRVGDDAVFCWGAGEYGRQGDGATSDNDVPARVGSLTGARHLMIGKHHACAVMSDSGVQCWGRGAQGRLGQDNDSGDKSSPVAVLDPTGSDVISNASTGWAAGQAHTCVGTLEGFVLCWGENGANQLGDDSTTDRSTPVGVYGILTARQVVSSHNHTCALLDDGTAVCWGEGANYKLGTGSTANQDQAAAMLPDAVNEVSFGDGGLDRGLSHACRAGSVPPEDGCVRDYNVAENKPYYFCEDAARTWSEAALACDAAGLELANPNSDGEGDYITAGIAGGSTRTWLGVKRVTDSSWQNLGGSLDFETTRQELIYVTTREYRDRFFGADIRSEGYFTGPAPAELNDSTPWNGQSTWESYRQPNPEWGYNCVSSDENGKWRSENCSAVPDPGDCGFLGLGCLLGAIFNLVFGILSFVLPWLFDPIDLLGSNGGQYTSPHFAGGPKMAYVCELEESHTDMVLDPGEYWVTVKGLDDGVVANACEGEYELTIGDLGSPSGGFIACDDDSVAETTDSVIEADVTAGSYWLVLKGRYASDEGAYNLTVRDVNAEPDATPLACDDGAGLGDAATTTFTANPGTTYHALVKGERPGDAGPYTFSVRPTSSSSTLGCDDASGPTGGSELTLDLPTGDYHAVLKGRSGGEGNYQLTIGGGSAMVSTFVPPTYADTITALNAEKIRVATVLWCTGGGDCADAGAQWTQLAADTDGVMRMAAAASDIPTEIVTAVSTLEALDSVTASLVLPAPVPGFTNVSLDAVTDPGNLCTPAAGAAWADCQPGATPTFSVSLTHPVAMPVPPAATPTGAYEYTLVIEGTRNGETLLLQSIPLFVFPEGTAPPGTFGAGTYHQSFDSRGCDGLQDPNLATFRPSWDSLLFKANVLPDTSIDFHVCTADDTADLDGCDSAATNVSGYFRSLTITAGSGAGTPCTAPTEAVDCPGGFCSPYSGICNYIEGNSCASDTDCPGMAMGSCQDGPSVGTLGQTCAVVDRTGIPSAVLSSGNFRPFMRLKADLTGSADGSVSPSLYEWMVQYHCRQPE